MLEKLKQRIKGQLENLANQIIASPRFDRAMQRLGGFCEPEWFERLHFSDFVWEHYPDRAVTMMCEYRDFQRRKGG